jgi:hypothetical protein
VKNVYSEGKKRLLEEKANPKPPEFSAVAVLKAADELKQGLPMLQERIVEIERLEESYLKRKADLKGIDESLAGFRMELDALSVAVRRIAESVGNVEEYNRKRLAVLNKLESVLDLYNR